MEHVAVRSFDNYMYANILMSRLKEEGFDCYLKDENTVTIDPLLSPALGGIKVMVPEQDLARVNQVIDLIEVEYLSTLPCPVCQQTSIQALKKTNRPGSFFTALLFQLVNGSTSSEQKTYRCGNCGHKLTELPGFTGS
jgi:hypothetical protein